MANGKKDVGETVKKTGGGFDFGSFLKDIASEVASSVGGTPERSRVSRRLKERELGVPIEKERRLRELPLGEEKERTLQFKETSNLINIAAQRLEAADLAETDEEARRHSAAALDALKRAETSIFKTEKPEETPRGEPEEETGKAGTDGKPESISEGSKVIKKETIEEFEGIPENIIDQYETLTSNEKAEFFQKSPEEFGAVQRASSKRRELFNVVGTDPSLGGFSNFLTHSTFENPLIKRILQLIRPSQNE